jgi:putative zinc finger/helix-turn-helix YgiT family protein
MEKHEVEIVEVEETNTFKGESVTFNAIYEYCVNTGEYSETEELMKANDLAQKDAYRRKVRLLTSDEIKKIRSKYGVNQKDFSEVLGWGQATIARYENHQVQDRAHDNILRKIDIDPKWFIELLGHVKYNIDKYEVYLSNANALLKSMGNFYVKSSTSYNYNFTRISCNKEDEIETSCRPSYKNEKVSFTLITDAA